MAEILADDISSDDRRRVVSAGIRHGRDAADRGHAGDRRPRGHERDVDRHCDPRGAPRPQSCPLLGQRPDGPSAFHIECSTRRDRRRRADRGASCSTSTTSTPPSRSSTPGTSPAKRPPTRTHGQSSRDAYAALNRHELPETTPDYVIVDHRRLQHIEAGDLTATLRCRMGPHAGRPASYIEAVHRLTDLGAVVT